MVSSALLTGVLAGIVLTVAGQPVAHAADETRVWLPGAVGSFALAFNAGIGSAVGFGGATFTYSRLGPVEAEVGVGAGLSGAQASAMMKLGIWGNRTGRLVVGVGVADTFDRYNSDVSGKPVWLNLDLLSWESRGTVFFSFAMGLTRGLGGGTWLVKSVPANGVPCSDECYDDVVANGIFPQLRFQIGGWGG
jgi:hypothetical protein